MGKVKNVRFIETIDQYNKGVDHITLNPLVGIVDFSRTSPKKLPVDIHALCFDFYIVFLKQGKHCELKYGRHRYDYQDGSLVFLSPGQVVSIEDEETDYQPEGFALLFHPDLIKGTPLGRRMKDFTFFSYDVWEALHLSVEERNIVLDNFRKIEYELKHAVDKHSKRLIAANIELFLDYCVRFYDRQFLTRGQQGSGVVEAFERLLHEYFAGNRALSAGIPSVAYFAAELHLSANYFGDLVKKETGRSAQEHIQSKLLDTAKIKIFEPDRSISGIAYELGFTYPQHFTRFFKQHTGYAPNEYRMLND